MWLFDIVSGEAPYRKSSQNQLKYKCCYYLKLKPGSDL